MENIEQYEKEARETIRLYVHEYCFMEILDENFRPDRIVHTYQREFYRDMKYFGLYRADEKYLRIMVCEWLRQKYGREYGSAIRKRFSNRYGFTIPRSDKFFMPISEFNELLDRAIYYRKNRVPYPWQITV